MASGRRGQTEINLGAGHVAGMFLGVLVLCGVFFTLGYVIGHGRPSTKLAASNERSPAVDSGGNLTKAKGTSASTGWDFFPSKSSSSNSSRSATPGLTPRSSAKSPAPAEPVSMESKPSRARVERKPPSLPNGSGGISLQVAALSNRTDALALAGFLKQKGYPAFAWGPSSDRLFRVQVGPYPDSKVAEKVKVKLEKEGFKSILKK